MIKAIDSHSHINFPAYDKDREQVLERMRENRVGSIDVGTTLESSREAVELVEKHDNIWASIGIHPSHANDDQYFDKNELREQLDGPALFNEDDFEKLINNPKVVAVGECGLDYFRLQNNDFRLKEQQRKLFVDQIEFSIKHNKPLILHCREAHQDALEILKKYQGLRGTVHFFTGTLEESQEYVKLGFSVGLDGPITFVNDYDKLIEGLPLDKILIETDCPYASPAPYRGKRNEPSYVIEIAKKIAEVKKLSLDEVAKQTLENTKKLFSLNF